MLHDLKWFPVCNEIIQRTNMDLRYTTRDTYAKVIQVDKLTLTAMNIRDVAFIYRVVEQSLIRIGITCLGGIRNLFCQIISDKHLHVIVL